MTGPIVVSMVELVENSDGKHKIEPNGDLRPEPVQVESVRETDEDLEFGSNASGEGDRQVQVNQEIVQHDSPAEQHTGSAEAGLKDQGEENSSPAATREANVIYPDKMQPAAGEAKKPQLIRKADEFVSARHEKLTFRIVMFGVSVGSAVLEAVTKGNEVIISSTVNSNAAISSIYPVSDFAETRLVSGRYLINRLRQREGSFTSDTVLTLGLKEKSSYWVDLLHGRYAIHTLPRDDVLDNLSGFYYLRKQPLEIGKSVTLQLYDGDRYAATTVEVLRREHVSLPGFREIDALVVHPLIKTDGIFRSTGDIQVWLSDDERRVPVRLETSIPLGRVRAELVSAEVDAEGK